MLRRPRRLRAIKSLPDVYHLSIDMLEDEIKEISELGIEHIMLFGVPDEKDECASQAFNDNGIVQKAIRKVKEINSDINVITDVCMCQYTSHGHCGILTDTGYVDNDKSLEYLAKISVSHAKAGADMVAPSDMMDGRIQAIREALDENGLENVGIMAYSVKYASNYYGPFRDILEGADILMVKPALSYLDIIRRVKDNFDLPLAAYNVSGEYSMLKFAVKEGLLNEDVILESITSIKRAGADIIITYFAKDIAKLLKK